MKRLLVALSILALPALSPAVAHAKKKKTPPTSASAQKSKDANKPPPPNDKRTNEGAQGRMNATEDAAQSADSPQFQNRP
ncbi:MAG TPA: hypothetical protein VGL86_00855 [Polyangia bacterium]